MSKIIRMTGTRPDGIKIGFSEKDIDKIRFEQFTSIEVLEQMTEEEVLVRYGSKSKTKIKKSK